MIRITAVVSMRSKAQTYSVEIVEQRTGPVCLIRELR